MYNLCYVVVIEADLTAGSNADKNLGDVNSLSQIISHSLTHIFHYRSRIDSKFVNVVGQVDEYWSIKNREVGQADSDLSVVPAH